MLGALDRFLYVYVVTRDFGFAPNPFHGYCTLATCKPRIRKTACVDDWVMGVGGSRHAAQGKCVYLMKITETSTFEGYWSDERFQVKKPLRNGSLVMMVGDNIYHRNPDTTAWIQEDSHHSSVDGSPNMTNITRDTSSTNVLISDHFYYFGMQAPNINLASIGYRNGIGYKKIPLIDCSAQTMIQQLEDECAAGRNLVLDDPFDFTRAHERVDQSTGKFS